MRSGHATRVLLIVPMIAAWGCRSEPDGPAAGQRPAPGSSDSRPAAAPSAPEPAPGQPVAESEEQPTPEQAPARLRALREGKALTPPFRAKAIATGDPELDPLVSFLRARFAKEIQAGKKLVIEDQTDLHLLLLGTSYQEFVDSLLKDASDQVPAEMIRDFGDKNRQARAVWPELTKHLPAHLLSRAERGAVFTGNADDNWKRFYEKYPGATGILTVSRVGLNREKDRALFYLGQGHGSLSGHGQLYVLKKEGDEWVDQRIDLGSSWDS
jgi:hypothetical protein